MCALGVVCLPLMLLGIVNGVSDDLSLQSGGGVCF